MKKAIVFIDGNNWYHNVKSVVKKPKNVNLKKLSENICEHFNLNLVEIRYYNSIPDINDGDENYYKHMVFLAGLKRDGILVYARKLKKIRERGRIIKIEKGVDVNIVTDIVDTCFIEGRCDCCVLISGDSDFIPVMHLAKKMQKEVLTTSVMKGYARELLKGDFRFWIMKKKDVLSV